MGSEFIEQSISEDSTVVALCVQAEHLVRTQQLLPAERLLQEAAKRFPRQAVFIRLLAKLALLQKRQAQALGLFQRAVAMSPEYLQAQSGLAQCLLAEGRLPEAREHFRVALGLMLAAPVYTPKPAGDEIRFDAVAAERGLWRVLSVMAKNGVHAFATSGTLLGLTREGALLPFDKDMDIGLPFAEMPKAIAVMQALGWKPLNTVKGLVNPVAFSHPQYGVIDLCGFSLEAEKQQMVSGFWFESREHPWSRVTEFPRFKLNYNEQAGYPCWHVAEPGLLLEALYGADWVTPQPDFDTVIAACNLRGFTLLTECFAYARILSNWQQGRVPKAHFLARTVQQYLSGDALMNNIEHRLSAIESYS